MLTVRECYVWIRIKRGETLKGIGAQIDLTAQSISIIKKRILRKNEKYGEPSQSELLRGEADFLDRGIFNYKKGLQIKAP